MSDVKLYRYKACRLHGEIPFSDTTDPDEDHFDISLVTVGSKNRFFAMPLFAGRWDGPIIFTIYLKKHQVNRFNSFLRQPKNSILCSPRIQIFTFVVSPGSYLDRNYPINILRNFGIQHVQTSHFIVLDIDMWPNNSYQILLDLPPIVAEDPIAAVVIPSFFHSGWEIKNGTVEEQAKSVISKIPFTMKELLKCNKLGKCRPYKESCFTYIFLPHNWLYYHRKPKAPRVLIYNCWKNVYQEPYLLVKRNDEITFFPEKFLNYGFNKISYVEILRNHGYHFYAAGRMFGFDMPHLPGSYRKAYMKVTAGKNYYMYSSLRKRLRNVARNYTVLPICKKNNTLPIQAIY